jgi:dihydrofolate reductase
MRRLRYNVAASLDGFIATKDGGYDWIVADDSIDFASLFAQFDLFVMGRKTFETLRAQGDTDPTLGRDVLVASRTLAVSDRPGVNFVSEGIAQKIAALKRLPGKDIWLFGGGDFARTLFDAGVVDTVEVALMPVLLGEGVPMLPGAGRVGLCLESTQHLPSGIQMLRYQVTTRPTRD